MIFRKAVLVIHGFAGGEYDEEFLVYRLTPIWNLDVYTFTLPGHDSNLATNIKYKDWVHSAEEHLERLIKLGYREIYVVGHSMGGLLATYLAGKYKEITKVVLAAPAFQYLAPNQDNKVLTTMKNAPNLIKTYKAKEIISRVLKVSPMMLYEFTKLVSNAQTYPDKVTIPTLIIQGNADQLVPKESSEYVFEHIKSKSKKLVIANGMDHDLFRGEKKDIIIDEVVKFLCNRPNNKAEISNL